MRPRPGAGPPYSAAFLATAPTAGTHAAPITDGAHRHAVPRNVAVRGSEVSRGHILQHLLLQRQLGHQAPQTAILFLQFFQPARLFQLQPAVLFAPAVVSLLIDPGLFAGLADALVVGEFDFDLSQEGDDLLRTVLLPCHASAPLVPVSITFSLVQNSPAASRSGKTETRRAAELSVFSGPLETQRISIRIADIHLLHTVASNQWFFHLNTLPTQFLIRLIDICTPQEQPCIVVSRNTCSFRCSWTFFIRFVGRIQHQFGITDPEHSPVKAIRAKLR